ncbi:hypothetical protein AYX15_07184 [Cryptococcus neoformans]|nr:hypothetical protein AYX15_07184 [Cryptococcus neoformans var. grubii]
MPSDVAVNNLSLSETIDVRTPYLDTQWS